MKKIISIFTVIALVLIPAYFTVFDNNEDISSMDEKFIGSDYAGFYKMPIENFEDILHHSDLVVIGEVVDDGTENDVEVFNMTSDDKENFKEKFGKYSTETVTFTEFRVTEILNGELDEEVITVRQIGEAGSDYGETKIKNNQRMLLMLGELESDIYIIPALESGAFVITDGKTKSNGKDKAILEFENQNLDKILKEINKYYKKNNE